MTTHIPRKRFGQHFLTDTTVLRNIMDFLGLQKNDRVIEIGPGLGALTQYLLSELDHLNAVELDRDVIAILKEKYPANALTIHACDALDFNYAHLSKQAADLRIVGNLPYNISTPLLFKLFSEIHCIRDMHFMLQKEVVLRLTAAVGSADYGRLTVMSQYFCDNDYLFTVPPSAFNPPPKVDSAVVRLTPKKQFPLNTNQFGVFSNIVKEAFNYRRKTLANCLKKFISADALQALQIDPTKRPQDVSIEEFMRIAENILFLGGQSLSK
jgi:16S rRNA (adenine1518-N6/adenine1519-N6)-dimethyltransferase